jgi:hypothetical protein
MIWIWASFGQGLERTARQASVSEALLRDGFALGDERVRSTASHYSYTESPSSMICLNASPSSHPYEQLRPSLLPVYLTSAWDQDLHLVHPGRLPTPPHTFVVTTPRPPNRTDSPPVLSVTALLNSSSNDL